MLASELSVGIFFYALYKNKWQLQIIFSRFFLLRNNSGLMHRLRCFKKIMCKLQNCHPRRERDRECLTLFSCLCSLSLSCVDTKDANPHEEKALPIIERYWLKEPRNWTVSSEILAIFLWNTLQNTINVHKSRVMHMSHQRKAR